MNDINRSTCKTWCGLSYGNGKVPTMTGSPAGTVHRGVDVRSPEWTTAPAWCSTACRDLSLPPLAPAKHVERKPACKQWCGVQYGTAECELTMGETGYLALPDNEHRYCSTACRPDRNRPVPEAPKKGAGQGAPKRCGYKNDFMECTEVSGHDGGHCQDVKHKARWSPLSPEAPKAEAAKSQLCCADCGRSTDVCKFACADKGDCVRNGCPKHALPKPATAEKGPACSECKKTAPNVAMRVTREARELLCDICMTRKEEQVHDLMMFESTGKRYKGPIRLPRPAMAHASQWPDECEDAS